MKEKSGRIMDAPKIRRVLCAWPRRSRAQSQPKNLVIVGIRPGCLPGRRIAKLSGDGGLDIPVGIMDITNTVTTSRDRR